MQKNLVFRLDVSLMGVGRLRAVSFSLLSHSISRAHLRGDPGGPPYNGLYGEAPPEGGTFFKFQVYERVGISPVEVDGEVRKCDTRCIKD